MNSGSVVRTREAWSKAHERIKLWSFETEGFRIRISLSSLVTDFYRCQPVFVHEPLVRVRVNVIKRIAEKFISRSSWPLRPTRKKMKRKQKTCERFQVEAVLFFWNLERFQSQTLFSIAIRGKSFRVFARGSQTFREGCLLLPGIVKLFPEINER